MLEQIQKWMAAGDAALLAMGPVLTVLLALLGGYAATQFVFKFPLKALIPAAWSDWVIRSFAIGSTWVFAHFLGDLDLWLEIVVALLQPVLYSLAMAAAVRKWPWIEASVFGSANPSSAALTAAALRRARK